MEDAAAKAKEAKKNSGLLLVASARGFVEDAKALLEMEAVLEFRDKQGRRAVHFAAAHGKLEVVQFLMSKGAEMDTEDQSGRSPLHVAALNGHPDVAGFLLDRGAWIDAYDANDDTPLHLAARNGGLDTVRLLLERGAKGKLPNKRGVSPLGEALLAGRIDVAELLLKKGADVAERPRGWSLLHLAAGVGQAAAVKMLLAKGANPNDDMNDARLTPLHSAAMGGSAECARLLLDAGASTAAASGDGRLPLDLVDAAAPGRAKLQALLKPSAGAVSSRPQPPAAAAPPATPAQAFKALPPRDQLSRAQRWAELEDGSRELERGLAGLPRAVREPLAEARKMLQFLAIHQAIMYLHDDDDFQGDAARPEVRQQVDHLREHPADMERVMAEKPVVAAVLRELKRFQGVVAANGRHKVPYDELLVVKPDQLELDKVRRDGMRGMLDMHLRAAVAAASADTEEEAKAAAAAITNAQPDPPAPAAPAQPSQPAAASPEAAASSASLRPIIGLRKRGSGGSLSCGGSIREIESADGDAGAGATGVEEPKWGQVFTWKAFLNEMKRQLRQSMWMLIALVVFMFATGSTRWQRSQDAAAGGAPSTPGHGLDAGPAAAVQEL